LGRSRHKRVTRLVTLPDFLGLGIGPRLLDFVCQEIVSAGERASITTSHPNLRGYLQNAPRWRLSSVRWPHRHKRQVHRAARIRDSAGRAVASFEYT
jgi:hypothetical protein